jgi:predicted metallopeptidase
MKYEHAFDLKVRMEEIVKVLGDDMGHVELERVECIRSFGSSCKRTLARCHALGKLLQKAMKTKAFYAIEFLESFDKMDKKEQDKVIIHELMHIPKSFGGGFRHHDYVRSKNINALHKKFEKLKSEGADGNSFW